RCEGATAPTRARAGTRGRHRGPRTASRAPRPARPEIRRPVRGTILRTDHEGRTRLMHRTRAVARLRPAPGRKLPRALRAGRIGELAAALPGGVPEPGFGRRLAPQAG